MRYEFACQERTCHYGRRTEESVINQVPIRDTSVAEAEKPKLSPVRTDPSEADSLNSGLRVILVQTECELFGSRLIDTHAYQRGSFWMRAI